MIWTLLALLSLVVLGGFISYYGDLQGRRWGKRRVSWFGMRPKHTAILITSLTGAFISLLSIITLLLISPTVRDVVLRGERAITENKILIKQGIEDSRQSQRNLIAIDRQKAQTQQQLTTATLLLGQAQRQLAPLQGRVTALRQQKSALEQRVRDLEQRQTVETQQLAQARRQNAHYTMQNNLLGRQNLQLANEKDGLEKTNLALKEANSNLMAANNKLLAQNREFEREKAVALSTTEMLLHQEDVLMKQQNELQGKNSELEQTRSQLQVEIDQKQTELDQALGYLAGSREAFTRNYFKVRQGRISVRAGSELARLTLDAHMSPEAIRQQLMRLLDAASKTAQGYGAETDSNGRAVRIVSKLVPTLVGTESADEEDSLNALTSNLQGHNRPVVVVVRAVSNTVEEEQVLVDLTAYDVSTIFAPGQVLAARHLDANQTDKQIRQAIAQFLQTDVRAAAIKAGTIPQVDPATGNSQLGLLDPVDLVQSSAQARRLRGEVILRAIVTEPTTSADPLDQDHMRLDIQRADTKTQ